MEVYERIKARREELHLSVIDVADRLGVSKTTIYRYESAEIEKLPVQILDQLARVLNCSPAYLAGWEGAPEPAAPVFALSSLEELIIDRFRRLPEGEKNMILRSLGIAEEKGDMLSRDQAAG